MSESKRKVFTWAQKAKVSLAATIKGLKTINEIAQEFSVHPTQVNQWKKELMDNAGSLFEGKREPKPHIRLTSVKAIGWRILPAPRPYGKPSCIKTQANFKGENRPVDSVSWNDVQQFLTTLNQQQASLNLRLPSEAEWEYACRTGTTDTFNFDGELSLAKVNYRGTWYDYGKWGEGAL